MAEKQLLTKKGYEERVALLEHLKVDRRKEVAEKLKEAREQGDLSENAEYDAAKDEQRDIEARIEELETRDSEIDEMMALPENAVNVAKCVEFSKEKASIAERLEELYAQWETLSEEM